MQNSFHKLAILLGSATLLTSTNASPAPNIHLLSTRTTQPQPDCALVDCLSGLECVLINNTPTCIKPGTKIGPQCGHNRQNHCPAGQNCCNPSCGTCTPPGMGCAGLYCPPPQPELPPRGKACGSAICAADEYCCNESCGYCRKPGMACTMEMCISPGPEPKPIPTLTPKGVKCGPNICDKGEICCNESCGYCTKEGSGQGCTKEYCLLGPKCGGSACAFGEECCNDSCGYCVRPGEACTMEYCLPVS